MKTGKKIGNKRTVTLEQGTQDGEEENFQENRLLISISSCRVVKEAKLLEEKKKKHHQKT